MRTVGELEVEGKRLQVSNLNKVLYPKTGFTKAQVIDYYIRISHALLPHLKDRPLTLKRYPDGVDADYFYEKNCPVYRPEWIRTAPVSNREDDEVIHYCLTNDLATLVWAANLADLELHTSLSCYPEVDNPTMMVFDLDPGAPANIVQCAQVALWLRSEIAPLNAFPKTSGSKGLQVYVPLNTACDYDQTKSFAKNAAESLQRAHPELIVSRMAKNLRGGKVFVDWSQNDRQKTTICVYSLRARDEPTVSTPVKWQEVESALKNDDPSKLYFTSDETLKRVAEYGDLFEPILSMKQKL